MGSTSRERQIQQIQSSRRRDTEEERPLTLRFDVGEEEGEDEEVVEEGDVGSDEGLTAGATSGEGGESRGKGVTGREEEVKERSMRSALRWDFSSSSSPSPSRVEEREGEGEVEVRERERGKEGEEDREVEEEEVRGELDWGRWGGAEGLGEAEVEAARDASGEWDDIRSLRESVGRERRSERWRKQRIHLQHDERK